MKELIKRSRLLHLLAKELKAQATQFGSEKNGKKRPNVRRYALIWVVAHLGAPAIG